MTKWATGWCAAGLSIMSAAADASIVTLRVTGTIDYVENDTSLLPIPAVIGDNYTLGYSFDTNTADGQPADGTYGIYRGALKSVELTIGTSTVSKAIPYAAGYNYIAVSNDRQNGSGQFFDSYQTVGFTAAPAGTVSLSSFFLNLSTFQSTAPVSPMSGDLLPATAFDVTAFPYRNFLWSEQTLVNGSQQTFDSISGDIQTMSMSPVPLPATAWLMLSGLGGLAAFRRRPTKTEATSVGTGLGTKQIFDSVHRFRPNVKSWKGISDV